MKFKKALPPKSGGLMEQVAYSMAVQLIESGTKLVTDLIVSANHSKIELSEWDSAYNNVNKLLYKINPEVYTKHRVPTTNNDFYELTMDTTYIVRLKNNNYMRVETYRNESKGYGSTERFLRIKFYGKNRYVLRHKFLLQALRLTDKNHIHVEYLAEYDMSCDVLPHSFDNIILDEGIKHRIVSGLKSWSQSKEWYADHQLVHKIGVFLYGKPGTGKSTVAKAISNMFGNAPILVINVNNIMHSINDILRMRKKISGTIIILIEDFDLFFNKRDDDNDGNNTTEETDDGSFVTETTEKKKKKKSPDKDFNQNAIFQLLDGVYSTDNTIYIATTNYKENIDSALIRHGRFDIQEELDYFNTKEEALKCVSMLGYDESVLDSLNITYPVQPAYLQSMIMEYRANQMQK